MPALTGRLVRLEPLSESHVADLARAAAGGRDSYRWTLVPRGLEETDAYVASLLRDVERGDAVAFAQTVELDGRRTAVGATRYMNLRRSAGHPLPWAVEIGGTWLAPSAQGTGVNTEAKLLLLTWAFESWAVQRVDLKTDARNDRSRAAIAGIGAKFEGILRSWQPSLVAGEEGSMRDSAMYSVVREEWPAARAALHARIGRTRPGPGS